MTHSGYNTAYEVERLSGDGTVIMVKTSWDDGGWI